MSELIRRKNVNVKAVSAYREGIDINGRHLEDDNWSEPVLNLRAAGITADESSSIASAVVDENGVRRRANATYYRLRHGWIAFPSHIIVTRLEQQLRRGDDHKLRPVGHYELVTSDRYDALEPPKRRSGTVPYDPRSTSTSNHASEGASEDFQKRFARGLYALSFLPGAVRRGVLKRVATADIFTGEAVQYSSGDRHEVSLLGLNETLAVLVHARTHRDLTGWEVDQYDFRLRVARSEISRTHAGNLPRGPRR